MTADAFPAMRAHEGVWQGTYRHLSPQGELEDQHEARVSCAFPAAGAVFYRQSILFTWPDGRERRETFEGMARDGAVWFDAPRFAGRSWESEGIVLLHLTRKDEPGAEMLEMITMGESGAWRARTWHWFKQGRLLRRTLCDERRVSRTPDSPD